MAIPLTEVRLKASALNSLFELSMDTASPALRTTSPPFPISTVPMRTSPVEPISLASSSSPSKRSRFTSRELASARKDPLFTMTSFNSNNPFPTISTSPTAFVSSERESTSRAALTEPSARIERSSATSNCSARRISPQSAPVVISTTCPASSPSDSPRTEPDLEPFCPTFRTNLPELEIRPETMASSATVSITSSEPETVPSKVASLPARASILEETPEATTSEDSPKTRKSPALRLTF